MPQLREGFDPESSRLRDAAVRRALGLADGLSATAAVLFAASVVGRNELNALALLAIPLVLLVSKISGLYDRDEHLLRKTTIDEIPTLFSVATLFAFVIWLAGDLVVQGTLGRDQALGMWALIFVAMFGTRVLARRLARGWSDEERCLVLGDERSAAWLDRKLRDADGIKASVIGRVALGTGSADAVADASSCSAKDLERVICERRVDRVIIAPDDAFSGDMLDLIRQVKAVGVKVSVLPRLFEVVGSSVEFDEVDGLTLLGVRRYGLTRSSRFVKRCLDLVVTSLTLLLLGPMMLLIAVAIKLDTPGPVFFRQRRMGGDDVPFQMLKFRTMVDRADEQKAALMGRNEAAGGLFKIGEDPRVTKVGQFLRRTSLDELPQLLNVIRGEMSVVGPRPLVIDEDQRLEGWQRRRLMVPPGMTGLWQVFGSARIPMDEMVKIDYRYGANWSLWLDLKILLRTVPFMLRQRGM